QRQPQVQRRIVWHLRLPQRRRHHVGWLSHHYPRRCQRHHSGKQRPPRRVLRQRPRIQQRNSDRHLRRRQLPRHLGLQRRRHDQQRHHQRRQRDFPQRRLHPFRREFGRYRNPKPLQQRHGPAPDNLHRRRTRVHRLRRNRRGQPVRRHQSGRQHAHPRRARRLPWNLQPHRRNAQRPARIRRRRRHRHTHADRRQSHRRTL